MNVINDNSPTITSGSSFSATEGQTAIGTVTATDEDDALSYLLSGTDASAISINPTSGTLAFNNAPDYETKTTYSVTVTASDGNESATQNITITI